MRPLVLLLLLAGCQARIGFETTLPDDGTFAPGEPSAEALERYRRAAEYSKAHGGRSLLVVEGMNAVFEEQQNGHLESTPWHLYSGTKSFSCALAVVLAMDGTSLDAPASGAVREWRGDLRKTAITPRQLLNFTSGLEDAFLRLTQDGLSAEPRVRDKYALALSLDMEHESGTHFSYGSQHLMAFGAFVEAQTGRDPLELLEERVFTPIGLRASGWIRDPAGHPALPYGAFTTGREWAKFGVLVRDGGVWKGRRILDERLLSECFEGSAAMPGYGLAWWLNVPVPSELLESAETPVKQSDGAGGPLFSRHAGSDLVVAAGFNDQRLYVLPSRGLVVARLGSGEGKFEDAAFLKALLSDE